MYQLISVLSILVILDRNHFDNPVYSYQGGGRREDDIGLLNNTNHIRNNLVKQNNATLERKRMAVPSSSGDDDSCKGAYGLNNDLNSLKNKDADATNPNIYHSLEKLDHVYDEIKQKDKDVGEYENLLYHKTIRRYQGTIRINNVKNSIGTWKDQRRSETVKSFLL